MYSFGIADNERGPIAFPAPVAAFGGIASGAGGSPPPPPEPVVRKEFPETWIWDSITEERLVFFNS